MLTANQSFKIGFLNRCINDRVPLEDIPGRVKQAAELLKSAGVTDLLTKPVGFVADTARDVVKSVAGHGLGWGIPLALAAPPLAGAWAGHALGKATDIDDTDINDIKNQELVDEYHRQTDKLRRQHAVREYQRLKGANHRVFM